MIDWSKVTDRDFREVPPKLGTMALLLSAAAFVLVFATAADYGIASDVANYFASSLRIVDWTRTFVAELLAGLRTDALTRESVDEVWRWYAVRIPHPPLSRELGGLTWSLAHPWLDGLTAYRLAVMLSFAALVAWVTVFTHWVTRSRLAGLAGGLAVIAYPALFGHAHLAHTDLFLATFWFASAASLAVFDRTRRIGWLVAAGLLLGCAAATKFSGLLLAPVFVIWLVARRPREALPALVIVGLSAIALFFVVNPVMWVQPEVGLADYFRAGTTRAAGSMTRIRTEYFGQIYEFRPPFHYPWVWTLIVVPPTFLAAIAVAFTTVRRHWLVAFCLLNAGVLYAALLLPSAPMHDGIRLLLPVLPFQCVLVGAGVIEAIDWLTRRLSEAGRAWIEALVLVAVLAPAAAITVYVHPYQLSYVNFLVGGTSGADERGLEVTNLKEVFSPSVVADLAGIIEPGSVVDAGFLTEEVCFYRAAGLGRDWVVETPLEGADDSAGEALTCPTGDMLPEPLGRRARQPAYVFVLNREAVWRPRDAALWNEATPAYEIGFDGVPLFRAFRIR